MEVVIVFLVIYGGVTTFFLVLYKGKAIAHDRIKTALIESENNRTIEKATHFKHNQAWQKEAEQLKNIITSLNFKLSQCMQKIANNPTGTSTKPK